MPNEMKILYSISFYQMPDTLWDKLSLSFHHFIVIGTSHDSKVEAERSVSEVSLILLWVEKLSMVKDGIQNISDLEEFSIRAS